MKPQDRTEKTSYSTYILGKDDYEVNPYVRCIQVKEVKLKGVGYEIVYSVPLEFLDEFNLNDLPEGWELRIVRKTDLT